MHVFRARRQIPCVTAQNLQFLLVFCTQAGVGIKAKPGVKDLLAGFKMNIKMQCLFHFS